MLLLSMACGLLAITASAQILKGDMNDDGVLDVIDLNATTATILGQQEKKFIKTGGDPFAIDNTPVIGSWYYTEEDELHIWVHRLILRKDGSTNYSGAATYEFHPYQGRIVFLNASGEPVSRMSVINLKESSMVCAINGQSPLVTYSPIQNSPVTEIQLSATNLEMKPNETKQLTATVLPTYAFDNSITWTSSNESVATVTDGNVNAVGYGKATITCSANDGSGVKATCEVDVTPEYVDLGLPGGVLWAAYNIGAEKPEELGKAFAWGDIVGYYIDEDHQFNIPNYKWCLGRYISDIRSMTKYCTDSRFGSYGNVDNKSTLDPEDDAATANWGSSWRMPTAQEIEDLINTEYTTLEFVTFNNVSGCKITSKKNGNSIFLPRNGTQYVSYNYYWSKDLNLNSNDQAYSLRVQENHGYKLVSASRAAGLLVRPVRVSTK